MTDPTKITFRKLQLEDLQLLQQWLTSPHVHEWYDKDKQNSQAEVNQRYGPKIRGEKPTDCYFVLYANQPVAYIQTYFVNDWPGFGQYVGYDDRTVSIDLFIGDPNLMGKGFGSLMLRQFLTKMVFSNPEITTCIVGPEPANKRAIGAYQKVGFKYVKTVQIPGESTPTHLMELLKAGFVSHS